MQTDASIHDPLVSVIVPTRDRPVQLAEAIDSVSRQTLRDLEIIVVNDGGREVTPPPGEAGSSTRLRILPHVACRGVAAARNTGLRAARGRYIAYLDDDDIFYPEHLEVLVHAAESSGHAVAYGLAHKAEIRRGPDGTTVARSVAYPGGFCFEDLLVHNRVPVLCVVHRRSCINAVGSFDESLATHEDWDFWIRLFGRFQAAYVGRTTCEFRVSATAESLTRQRRENFYRTMGIVHDRYRHLTHGRPAIREAQRRSRRGLARELAVAGTPVDLRGRFHQWLRGPRAKPLETGH